MKDPLVTEMKETPNQIEIEDDSQEFVVSRKSDDEQNIEIEEDCQPDPNEVDEEGSVDEALLDPNALDSDEESAAKSSQSEEIK